MIKTNFYIGSRYPVDRKKLRQAAETLLGNYGVDNVQLDISIVGSRRITQLNESQLKHEGATDVLSFPQHEKDQISDLPLPAEVLPHLGDIVISFPEAVRNAKRFGKMVDDQLCFYLQHGLMHLLGYHHDDH